MDLDNLRDYINKRSKLAASVARTVLEAINHEVRDLPEEGLEELGDVICSASNEIAETIFAILAAVDDDDDEDDEYDLY